MARGAAAERGSLTQGRDQGHVGSGTQHMDHGTWDRDQGPVVVLGYTVVFGGVRG